MRNILAISSSSEMDQLVSETLEDTCLVKCTHAVRTALQMHQCTPFDIILVDLGSPELAAAFDPFAEAIQPFAVANPMVQFVAILPKEAIGKSFNNAKEATARYLTHPVNKKDIHIVFESIKKKMIKNLELDYLRDHFWKTDWLEVVHSKNPAMQKVFEGIRAVAPTIATVLLLGETGTGKGLMARLVHWHSHRFEEPFVAVHCGAIPDTLIESELFGHEKGAFTGADRRKIGKFEMANSGTIFLDEIGTITPAVQVKLLQVLQDGTYSRVGGEVQLKSKARVIAASNADLNILIDKGLFREDLYFRLNIFPLTIPPLRNHIEDLPFLIDIFLKNLTKKYGKEIQKLHPVVAAGLNAYHWPGNIRELENILERAYILGKSDILMPENFSSDILSGVRPPALKPVGDELTLAQARQIAMAVFEENYLKNLLKQSGWKIKLAAEKAGITPRQLNRLVTRNGIRRKDSKA